MSATRKRALKGLAWTSQKRCSEKLSWREYASSLEADLNRSMQPYPAKYGLHPWKDKVPVRCGD